jgi:short subunit dehydrogenase-like uncharacterized protein
MQSNQFLLYGANGYTGELIARYSGQFGLKPILAGRSKQAIESIAERLNLSFVVFDLSDKAALLDALRQVKLVVHAAGPFVHTAKQMIEACIEANVHYVDINGDVPVFEMIRLYNEAATGAGIQLLPGAGFDVVPTDCLAMKLKRNLPDAHVLQLAFAGLGAGISHGTALTMLGRLGEKSLIRKDGILTPIALGKKGMWVDFFAGKEKPRKKLWVMNIQWGDVSTAYFTTGIPNIEVYTAISRKWFRLLKFQGLFNWLLRTRWMRNYLRKKIEQRPAGPSDEQRAAAKSLVWGRATNKMGESVEMRMAGPEGYSITTFCVLLIAQKILNGNFKPGYQTPASAYGDGLIEEVQGVEIGELVD